MVERIQGLRPAEAGTVRPSRPEGIDGRGRFAEILREKLAPGEVRFSQHALARLESREIELSAGHLARLERAVSLAAAKGARESLVLMDDLALLVSVSNRTVITALKGTENRERVYTNIDSAVII
ncbi:MAG: TIGR02530 family flagellar biosynthesis protein [Clostridia bacterium]|nr:flagellar protein [Clostridia bacterium]MDH7573458.1 TIGR02530 family flagellar biosynthesis protein [Clostridia bacterium]